MTDAFDAEAAVQALEERGVLGAACPMCGKKKQWDVGEDGFFELATLKADDDSQASGEARPSIGAVAVQCRHCGFVALHARSVLGLVGSASSSDPDSSS